MTLPTAIALVFTSALFWFWFECWEPFAGLPAASNFLRIFPEGPPRTFKRNTEKDKMTLLFGSKIASILRNSSRFEVSEKPLKTLQDLLKIIAENPPKKFATIKSACAAWALYLGKALDEIPIESLFEKDTRKGFRPFLVGRISENSIRTYVDHIRWLSVRAKELCAQQKDAVPAAWQKVVERALSRGCLGIALYFARIKDKPQAVTSKDTNALLKKLVDDGAYYMASKAKIVAFWRLLHDLHVNGESPELLHKVLRNGIRFKSLPDAFREDIERMFQWRLAKWAKGRPDDKRLRLNSITCLRATICSMFSHAKNDLKLEIATLPALFSKAIVESFIDFEINTKNVDGHYLRKRLEKLCSAIRIYPPYQPVDLGWCKEVLSTLPKNEDKEKIKQRKSKSKVEHKLLRTIPALMRVRRLLLKAGTVEAAIMLRNELLWSWLLVLPWRQMNIRLARIGGDNPNIFKGPITGDFELPPWVKEEQQKASKESRIAEFWQIRFSKEETKVKHSVEAVLPLCLVPLLEEYLGRDGGVNYRNLLLGEIEPGIKRIDPQTLFLSDRGFPLSKSQVTDLIETLTLRWVNKVINPHRWRDLFAYAWLQANPKDYLTLSKALWHQTLTETLETYGAEYGIANAVVATESWAKSW